VQVSDGAVQEQPAPKGTEDRTNPHLIAVSCFGYLVEASDMNAVALLHFLGQLGSLKMEGKSYSR
jgi:hypothetical protein